MILVARKVVEQLAEHQKQVSASREVAAGKTMPGYRSYEAAIEAQLEFAEPAEAQVMPEDPLQTAG